MQRSNSSRKRDPQIILAALLDPAADGMPASVPRIDAAPWRDLANVLAKSSATIRA